MKPFCKYFAWPVMVCFFWAANGCKPTETKPTTFRIPIKVAVIYNFGGAQAVAREEFSLLSTDAVGIWSKTGVFKDNFGLEWAIDRMRVLDGKPSKFREAIKPYIVKSTTTDFEGNAVFEDVPKGEYFIFGATETRGGSAVWNLKVSTDNTEVVFLDNKNAYYAR